MSLPFILTLLLLGILAAPARADVTGTAKVVNGDTLTIMGKRIGLYAVDAPERDQLCLRDGKTWPCGVAAAKALQDIIGQRTLWCRKIARDYENRRNLSICFFDESTGHTSVNAKMVMAGWAMANRHYSRRFSDLEAEAKAAGRGLWAGRFVPPRDWRRGDRLDKTTPDSANSRPSVATR